MKKAEILKELQRMADILEMDAQEYADMMNAKDEKIVLDASGSYPFRCGYIESAIKGLIE